jgi:hypothetical protein
MKLAIASAQCKSAHEQRDVIFATKQVCMRLVEASATKSQQLITSAQKQSEKKIATITHWANKRIEMSQFELEGLQQDCTIQESNPSGWS